MDKLLTLEPGMIIWTFLTFTLLLFILKRFAWKPLLNSLEKREERIHSDLQRAEHAREEAEKLVSEHKKTLAGAELEARRIMDEARKTAEKVRNDIVDKANEQARAVAEQAKAEIRREKESVLAQMRGEIAELAIGAAGKILRESIDNDRNRKLVDEYITAFPSN